MTTKLNQTKIRGDRKVGMATDPLRFLCCCSPPYAHEDTYLGVTGRATVLFEAGSERNVEHFP
jgi:hypothetical protein